MNTKKHLPMSGTRVDEATRTLRAYKHPYRYNIIGRLLNHGMLSSGEIASHLNLDEPYIVEQLDILRKSDLVILERSEHGEMFRANEPKLLRMKQSVSAFNNSQVL